MSHARKTILQNFQVLKSKWMACGCRETLFTGKAAPRPFAAGLVMSGMDAALGAQSLRTDVGVRGAIINKLDIN